MATIGRSSTSIRRRHPIRCGPRSRRKLRCSTSGQRRLQFRQRSTTRCCARSHHRGLTICRHARNRGNSPLRIARPFTLSVSMTRRSCSTRAPRRKHLWPQVSPVSPEPPLGAYPYDGPRAYALFGLTSSWVAEFIDNSPWIGQSDVDAFVTAWANQAVAFAPTAAPQRSTFLTLLHTNPFNHDRVLQASVALEAAVTSALPKAEKRQVLFGVFAAQLAYNAAVLRDDPSSRLYLRVLADISEVDPISPDVARLRAKAAAVASGDWANQFALGRDLSVAILNASAAP